MVMEELATYRLELIGALMRVVEELSPLVAAMPIHARRNPLAPNFHSSHFILAHLRALDEQEFVTNLRRIQAQDLPLLAAFDERAWMEAHYRQEEPASEILEGLRRMRGEEVEWLRNLPYSDWSRMGRHPWWGLRSLQWWVERQLDSSLQHRQQLKAFLTQ